MNKKRRGKAVAVIDIGSSLIQMRVSQLCDGAITDIDVLRYPTQIGHEVFSTGKISFDSLKEMISMLRGYAQVMLEYGVTQYKVVATSVLREAKNRAYVVDQIKIQNDMAIEVLEDDQEKTLIYSEILNGAMQDSSEKIDTALISYIGTGSIGLAIYDRESVVFSQNIAMGSLKLHDLLSGLQDRTEEFYQVLHEYLASTLGRIQVPAYLEKLNNMVVAGNEIELIAKLCAAPLEKGRYSIDAKKLEEVYHQVRVMTKEQISERYQLSENQAEILYFSLAICRHLLDCTLAKRILCPKVELWDALVRQLLFSKCKGAYDDQVRENAISCALQMVEHYGASRAHDLVTRDYALKIFDKMKKHHGMGPKKRLLLELAAILHEIGYYVNSKNHLLSTYDLIKNSDIYGMTQEEVNLIGIIASYCEFFVPDYDDHEYQKLTEKNRLFVDKLVAILRLANALDRSQKQKLQSLTVRLKEEILTLTGVSENITVYSIVGQLLEHSRIFKFENAGNPKIYMGSADWMPRNLDRRVELVFPIDDQDLKERTFGILELMLSDTVNARIQQPDTTYAHIDKRGKAVINSQTEFARLAREALEAKQVVDEKKPYVPKKAPTFDQRELED